MDTNRYKLGLSIFLFMHELCTIPTTDMVYTRSQTKQIWQLMNINYKHLKLSLFYCFSVFDSTSVHTLLFINKWIIQICLNVNVIDCGLKCNNDKVWLRSNGLRGLGGFIFGWLNARGVWRTSNRYLLCLISLMT